MGNIDAFLSNVQTYHSGGDGTILYHDCILRIKENVKVEIPVLILTQKDYDYLVEAGYTVTYKEKTTSLLAANKRRDVSGLICDMTTDTRPVQSLMVHHIGDYREKEADEMMEAMGYERATSSKIGYTFSLKRMNNFYEYGVSMGEFTYPPISHVFYVKEGGDPDNRFGSLYSLHPLELHDRISFG